LDVAAAAACTTKAIPVAASLLEKQITVVGQPTVVVTVVGIFDPAALAAFQRLWQRCRLLGIHFWHLLWRGTATDWELCMTKSFAEGASMNLEESTIIQQVSQAAFACMHACFDNSCFIACQQQSCASSMREGMCLAVSARHKSRTGKSKADPPAAAALRWHCCCCNQLVQEFRVALCIGRKLMFRAGSADVEVSIMRTIQCCETSGSMFDVEVDLLWPGEARSVVRVTEAWWDAKVCMLARAW
jgi:hypothetical protein